jgi:hypothetical protein
MSLEQGNQQSEQVDYSKLAPRPDPEYVPPEMEVQPAGVKVVAVVEKRTRESKRGVPKKKKVRARIILTPEGVVPIKGGLDEPIEVGDFNKISPDSTLTKQVGSSLAKASREVPRKPRKK